MNNPIIMQLVSKILDSGCTPEEACRETPDLLAEVREQLSRVRSIDAQIDGLFPESQTGGEELTNRSGSTDDLPHVPGHEVLSTLGHGGMGVVYRARHMRLHRIVAVKMLLAGSHADQAGLKRLLREAEAVAALTHSNIVQVYEVGDCDGLPYFTMELVEGGSLRERIERGLLEPREAASLVSTLARAMDVAHSNGIVHRDLKPANVLLTPDGVPKIADFGLARRLDVESSLTHTDAPLGTPSYMAPEQIQGGSRAVGPAADVYALGAILYATLTGRPPFKGTSSMETLRQVLHDELAPPSRLNARVPRDLETICVKCLNKDPDRRYTTAADLASDLDRFGRGEPILAKPVGRLERMRKWARRRPAHATIAVGSVVAVLAVAAAGLWLNLKRATIVRAAEQDLLELDREASASNWSGARTAVERARARLMGGGFAELLVRVEQGAKELAAVDRFDTIRDHQMALEPIQFETALDAFNTDSEYEKMFAELGIVDVPVRPQEAAAQIRNSRIRPVLVDALDTWAVCARSQDVWNGVLQAARLADPGPTDWRDRVRDPAAWGNKQVLANLMIEAPVSSESVLLLLTLAEHVVQAKGDAVPFLERIQQEHPDNYWANSALGSRLVQRTPDASLRYFQAAAAVRPESTIARGNLGAVLTMCGQRDEGMAQLKKSIAIDPANVRARVSLSTCLQWKGKFAEAVEELRTAMRLNPSVTTSLLDVISIDLRIAVATDSPAQVHESLGHLLLALGRLDDAITNLRESIRLDSSRLSPRGALAKVFITRGLFDESRKEAKLFLEGHPTNEQARRGAKVLLDHCDLLSKIEADLPSILDDKRIPQNGAECLAFADLCRAKQNYPRAVRYFTEAFDLGVGTPVRDANWRTSDAARCAIMASVLPDGAPEVAAESQRTTWRNLAYTWLKLEIGALNGVLEKDAPTYGKFVLKSLENWRLDPSFAGVRDETPLARLPESEQAQWRKLWGAAAVLRKRARK